MTTLAILPQAAAPIDAAAARELAAFLDEVEFGSVAAQVGGGSARMFLAPFLDVQELLKRTSAFYRLLFSLLSQGHAISDGYLRAALPGRIIEAMRACGVIVQDRDRNWHTDNLCIVAVQGLYLVASLPPHYPTARTSTQPIYLGVDSFALAEALPRRCEGWRVLDLCSGTGLHGLLAAARGADAVLALDAEPAAVAAGALNAMLNRLEGRVQVAESDLFGACRPADQFDLIIANPPSWPSPSGHSHPRWGNGGEDGTAVLRRLLPELLRHLAPDGRALLMLNAIGPFSSIGINEELLGAMARSDGFRITAFVHAKHLLAQYAKQLEQMLETLHFTLSREERGEVVERWLRTQALAGPSRECVYSQIVRMDRSDTPEAVYVPTYPVTRTDPLVGAIGGDL